MSAASVAIAFTERMAMSRFAAQNGASIPDAAGRLGQFGLVQQCLSIICLK